MTPTPRASEAKHTPMPWKASGLSVTASTRGIVATCPTPQNGGTFECSENAAFIVHAASNHAALVEALRAVHDWRGLCDENATETFERIGEMFWKDTGFMRPGKDYPRECPVDEEAQRQAWSAWVARKNNELDTQIRAALARANEKGS